ncbi:MAG: sugar transferase [Verrucomicrobiia bacterium]|jgi:exopolysaccharide biosynthesis polyprenyl glycosylphosphotransferase
MINARTLKHHWWHVSAHFLIDIALFCLAFLVGIRLRFAGEWNLLVATPMQYAPSILLGSVAFASCCYIMGFYSPQIYHQNLFKRALMIFMAMVISLILMTGLFYLNYSTRIGRGIMLYSGTIVYLTALIHHGLIVRSLQNYRERIVLVVTCEFDEEEMKLFDEFWGRHLELVGVVHSDNYTPKSKARILGPASRIREIVREYEIDRVVCTNKSFSDQRLYKDFCGLRYSGVVVMPLISLCEEIYQYVPIELMTYEWLMNASASPQMLYIKKIKRGFDIAVSIVCLILSLPVLVVAIFLIRVTSRGPIFYTQVRSGRFGRKFKMIKLRTMYVDAERDGAKWSQENDPRVTPVGRILRRYRIDEIPQLINVLRGDMSFVGPRPERPEFIDELARSIPFYQERLMVQPGLTGWAQVNYPYGSSVEDARRKLEYDLYYMKHMSIFLDLFILLDTIRTVLWGGVKKPRAMFSLKNGFLSEQPKGGGKEVSAAHQK